MKTDNSPTDFGLDPLTLRERIPEYVDEADATIK